MGMHYSKAGMKGLFSQFVEGLKEGCAGAAGIESAGFGPSARPVDAEPAGQHAEVLPAGHAGPAPETREEGAGPDGSGAGMQDGGCMAGGGPEGGISSGAGADAGASGEECRLGTGRCAVPDRPEAPGQADGRGQEAESVPAAGREAVPAPDGRGPSAEPEEQATPGYALFWVHGVERRTYLIVRASHAALLGIVREGDAFARNARAFYRYQKSDVLPLKPKDWEGGVVSRSQNRWKEASEYLRECTPQKALSGKAEGIFAKAMAGTITYGFAYDGSSGGDWSLCLKVHRKGNVVTESRELGGAVLRAVCAGLAKRGGAGGKAGMSGAGGADESHALSVTVKTS